MLEGITLLYRSSDLKVNFPFCQGDIVTLSENTTYNDSKHEAFDTDFNLITQYTMIVNTKLSALILSLIFFSFYHVYALCICTIIGFDIYFPHPAEHHTTWEPSGHIISLNALNGPGPEN